MDSKLKALQTKRDELIKAIKDKQKEMDCFDVSEYYNEDRFIDDAEHVYGTVNIIGYECSAIEVFYELGLSDTNFRMMYNDHINTLDKTNFEEYKELEEELEQLENELSEIDDEIEQLENE